MDRNGKEVGRAFLFYWRGRLNVIGISPHSVVKIVGCPQERLTYWRQEICWETVPVPDYAGLKFSNLNSSKKVLCCHAIISHLDAAANERIVKEWRRLDPHSIVVVLHGGAYEDFKQLPKWISAVHIPDEALRTKDHAREKQEYMGALRALAHWLEGQPDVTHVHLAEYDVVPIVENLGQQLVSALAAENADLMGSGVRDLTDSVHAHYLNLCSDSVSLSFLRKISCRENKERILAMLGCTSIWKIECLRDVAALALPTRLYLELAFPTLAHHLGWRIRPLPEKQQASITFQGDYSFELQSYRASGAWMVHPCKKYWQA